MHTYTHMYVLCMHNTYIYRDIHTCMHEYIYTSQGILQKSGNKFLTTRFFHQVVEKGS